LTLRVKLSSRAGTLGELTTAIGRAGGDIGAIDIVTVGNDYIIRDITVSSVSSEHGEQIVEAVKDIDGVELIQVSDPTFLMHLGGKIEVVSKVPLKTRADLSNPKEEKGTVHEVIKGADVFLGLSVPGVIDAADVKRMAEKPIVFAMANPTPEIMPEDAAPYVAVMATGRSDYPNQINNVLFSPVLSRRTCLPRGTHKRTDETRCRECDRGHHHRRGVAPRVHCSVSVR
jgi:hypothetical protein